LPEDFLRFLGVADLDLLDSLDLDFEVDLLDLLLRGVNGFIAEEVILIKERSDLSVSTCLLGS
jgi:hypothetical protein